MERVAPNVEAKVAEANARRAQFLAVAFACTFVLAMVGDVLRLGTFRHQGFLVAQLLGVLAVGALVRWTPVGQRHATRVLVVGLIGISMAGAAQAAQFGALDGPYFYGSYMIAPVLIPVLLSLPMRIFATLATVGGFVLVYWLRQPALFAHPMAHIPLTYLLTIAGISISLGHYVYKLECAAFADLTRLQIVAEALARQMEQDRHRPALAVRQELARQLHDDLAQLITGARIHLDGWTPRRAHDDVRPKLREVLDELARRSRRMLEELRTPAGGLPVLSSLEARMADLRSEYARMGLVVDLIVEPPAGAASCSPALAGALLGSAREALTNAVRHGGATEATVALRFDANCVELEVYDNGNGRAATVREGLGLLGIRERAESFGGTLQLSDYDDGLRVTVVMPRQEAA